MAEAVGDKARMAKYASAAVSIQSAIRKLLWVEAAGAFKDNTDKNNTLLPQDGNSLALWFRVVEPNSVEAGRISRYLLGNWGKFGASSPEWGGNIGTFPGSMEVHGHAVAGNTERAMELMRLQWGFMLHNANSTQSTFWEGYNADGTFNFKGIYMSNAHGWATGPAAALSTHVLGIRAHAPGGSRYLVSPSPGKLRHCQGSLRFTADHKVTASWQVVEAAPQESTTATAEAFELEIDTSLVWVGARGTVGLPLPAMMDDDAALRLDVDGELHWRRGEERDGIRHDQAARRVWIEMGTLPPQAEPRRSFRLSAA
jgi:hypothetical protein